MGCGCCNIPSDTGCLKATATRVGGIKAEAEYIPGLNAQAVRVDSFRAVASLVCTLADYYLRVTPKVMWLTEDEIQQLLIESNTTWEII